MAHSVSKSPNIAFILDYNHDDPTERAISERLDRCFQKNMVSFFEARYIECKLLEQYSIEFLSEDDMFSTAPSCFLLSSLILCKQKKTEQLFNVLSSIYSDPFFKRQFFNSEYVKFHPQNYGLNKIMNFPNLCAQNLTEMQKKTIQYVYQQFAFFDKELSIVPIHLKEGETRTRLRTLTDTILNSNFDLQIFLRIAEALAFMRIQEIHESSSADKSKEIPLSIINRYYSKKQFECTTLFYELSIVFRTQFQFKKLVKIIEEKFKVPQSDSHTIFAVRIGAGHGEILISDLKDHFKNSNIKDITLIMEDLPDVEQKIREKFFAGVSSSQSMAAAHTPTSSPVQQNPSSADSKTLLLGRSGNLESNDPSLKGLPMLRFSEQN